MQDFTKLRVWHLAREHSLSVIQAFPISAGRRVPGLRSQAIRAATSVPANIAEGCGRGTREEFARYVEIALASHNELDTHLRLAVQTGMLSETGHLSLRRQHDLVRQMLLSLLKAIQRRIAEDENARRDANPASD